jgi:hypothetical protein
VLVKLLRARSPNADNIDIQVRSVPRPRFAVSDLAPQYFGFKGYTGPTTYTYAELL